MKNQDLNNIIKNIRGDHTEKDAYFGLFYDHEDEYSCYIKANKEGLTLYACELLEASLEIGVKEKFSFSNERNYTNSDIHLSHVDLYNMLPSEIVESMKKEKYKQTWKDKLGGYFVGAIILFILISILIGAVTIIGWLF